MSVIKKRNPFQNKTIKQEKEETKLVGGYIPAKMVSNLRLLSVYYGKPLQLIIKEALDNWYSSFGNPDTEIIGELVGRATSEWARRKAKNKMSQKQYLEYLDELEERLKKKKISPDDINTILTQVENRIAQEWENEKNH